MLRSYDSPIEQISSTHVELKSLHAQTADINFLSDKPGAKTLRRLAELLPDIFCGTLQANQALDTFVPSLEMYYMQGQIHHLKETLEQRAEIIRHWLDDDRDAQPPPHEPLPSGASLYPVMSA